MQKKLVEFRTWLSELDDLVVPLEHGCSWAHYESRSLDFSCLAELGEKNVTISQNLAPLS